MYYPNNLMFQKFPTLCIFFFFFVLAQSFCKSSLYDSQNWMPWESDLGGIIHVKMLLATHKQNYFCVSISLHSSYISIQHILVVLKLFSYLVFQLQWTTCFTILCLLWTGLNLRRRVVLVLTLLLIWWKLLLVHLLCCLVLPYLRFNIFACAY